MNELKFYQGIDNDLPQNKDANSFYLTTDTNRLFVGNTEIQNKLIAGDNIQISGNTISSIGAISGGNAVVITFPSEQLIDDNKEIGLRGEGIYMINIKNDSGDTFYTTIGADITDTCDTYFEKLKANLVLLYGNVDNYIEASYVEKTSENKITITWHTHFWQDREDNQGVDLNAADCVCIINFKDKEIDFALTQWADDEMHMIHPIRINIDTQLEEFGTSAETMTMTLQYYDGSGWSVITSTEIINYIKNGYNVEFGIVDTVDGEEVYKVGQYDVYYDVSLHNKNWLILRWSNFGTTKEVTQYSAYYFDNNFSVVVFDESGVCKYNNYTHTPIRGGVYTYKPIQAVSSDDYVSADIVEKPISGYTLTVTTNIGNIATATEERNGLATAYDAQTYIDDEIAKKQDILTAGDHITIDSASTISVTEIGDLTTLETSATTDLVSAINELEGKIVTKDMAKSLWEVIKICTFTTTETDDIIDNFKTSWDITDYYMKLSANGTGNIYINNGYVNVDGIQYYTYVLPRNEDKDVTVDEVKYYCYENESLGGKFYIDTDLSNKTKGDVVSLTVYQYDEENKTMTAIQGSPLSLTILKKDESYTGPLEETITYSNGNNQNVEAQTEIASIRTTDMNGDGENTTLTSLIIPRTVTSLDKQCFEHCYALESITIPNTITIIPESAFAYCSGLTSVVMNQVTEIGENAFRYSALKNTDFFPNTLVTIGQDAFESCTSLTSITIPNSVTDIQQAAFIRCSNVTSVTLSNQITTIAQDTFSSCYSLIEITIPESVTSIGIDAFWNCSGLTSITLPDSVINLEQNAFGGCNGLTSVTLSNNLTTIGYGCFRECSGLTSITLPTTIKNIGGFAFQNCKLNLVTYDGVEYTSKSALKTALENNGATIDDLAFNNSGLAD